MGVQENRRHCSQTTQLCQIVRGNKKREKKRSL